MRLDARHIEALHLLCTAPLEQIHYDGWLVRRARDDVKRASSVNMAGASTLPLEEKIDHVERLYADVNLPPLYRLTSFSTPELLDTALMSRGYERIEASLEQVASLDRPLPAPPPGVTFHSMSLEDWLEQAAPIRGQPEPMLVRPSRLRRRPAKHLSSNPPPLLHVAARLRPR